MEMDFDTATTQIIDQDLGLKLAGNKPDLAKDLLTMLTDELPETKTNILEAYAKKDTETLRKVVHKLHGGASYCGVPRLKAAAFTLETTLKTTDSKPQGIDALVKTLLFELEQVLACYEESYQS